MTRNSLSICVLLFFWVSTSGYGQPRPLSLMEALRLGSTYSVSLQTAIQQETIATSNRRFGPPDRLPTVDLNIGQTNYFNQFDSPTSFVRGIYRDNALNGSVSGNWLIYAGGRVNLGQTRLEQQEQQARLTTEAVRQQLKQSIITTYYGAVMEQEKLRVRAEGVALSKARRQDFDGQQRLGKASTFDLLQAENLLLSDSTAYLQQELQVLIAQNRLQLIIGSNRFESLLLTDSLTSGSPPKPDLTRPDRTRPDLNLNRQLPTFLNLTTKLLSQNPNLRAQRVGVLVAGNNVQLQKTARLPTLRLNSSFYQSFTGTKFPDVPLISGSSTNFMLAGFSLTMPLLPNRETDRAVRQSELERVLTETNLKGDERRLLAQADLLNRSYQTQATIVTLSKGLTQNAAQTLDIARNRLQTGFSSLFEYRAVQLAYTEAKLNELQALYALKLIEADAKQLIGALN